MLAGWLAGWSALFGAHFVLTTLPAVWSRFYDGDAHSFANNLRGRNRYSTFALNQSYQAIVLLSELDLFCALATSFLPVYPHLLYFCLRQYHVFICVCHCSYQLTLMAVVWREQDDGRWTMDSNELLRGKQRPITFQCSLMRIEFLNGAISLLTLAASK